MKKNKIVIGSRESKLAVLQSEMVRDYIKKQNPELEVEILTMKTTGDIILDRTLDKVGGKGLFVKELDKALMDGKSILSVHSLKDMPAEQPSGLEMAITPEREDPRDLFVSFHGAKSLKDLPPGAVVATGSLRRSAQLKNLREDIEIKGIRGNVETRIAKAKQAGYDGIILAAAGIHRLGLDVEGFCFDLENMLPAPAQGILGLETRIDDAQTKALLQKIHHEKSHRQAQGERAFLRYTEGGCHAPMGVYCDIQGDTFTITGFFHTEKAMYRETAQGVKGQETEKGKEIALKIKEKIKNER